MGIFTNFTAAAAEDYNYTDDSSRKSAGYKLATPKKFKDISFDSVSIGDMYDLTFHAGTLGTNISDFEQQDSDLLMRKLDALNVRSLDTSDKLFEWFLDVMYHFWDIYEENDKMDRDTLKDPAIWPKSHIKLIEKALNDSWDGSRSGTQSIWWWVGNKKGGSDNAEAWANAVLTEYAAVSPAGSITTTRAIAPIRSEEDFIKEAIDKADFFVKGRGLPPEYDINIKNHDDLVLGEKKIGFVGASLSKDLNWFFDYKTNIETYMGITYFTERKYLKDPSSGEHISPSGTPKKNAGTWDIKMVNRTGIFKSTHSVLGLYADNIIGEMHKSDAGRGVRSSILVGDRFKPRKIQTLGSYKDGTTYFYKHTKDLTDSLGIQGRDLQGLEEFAVAAQTELKEVAQGTYDSDWGSTGVRNTINRFVGSTTQMDSIIDSYRKASLTEAKNNCYNKFKEHIESGDWAKKVKTSAIDRKFDMVERLFEDAKADLRGWLRPWNGRESIPILTILRQGKEKYYGAAADAILDYMDSAKRVTGSEPVKETQRFELLEKAAKELYGLYNLGKDISFEKKSPFNVRHSRKSVSGFEDYIEDVVARDNSGKGKRYTQKQWFKQFTSVLGYLIAFNYVTWKHTLENIGLWKAALQVPFSDITLKTDEELAAIIAAAMDYDQEIFDGNTSAAANADELTEEQIEERQLYLKQCALLLNMSRLRDTIVTDQYVAMGTGDMDFPYGQFILPMDVEDGGKGNKEPRSQMINRLIAPKLDDINAFLNLTPDIQAALVPKLRLFKVMSVDGELEEVEIVFPTRMSNKTSNFRVKDGKFSRGDGCGVKDFTMSFQGGNPATSRKDMNASLTLFFQDFSEFVKMRRTSDLFKNSAKVKTPEYRYVDLLLMPGSTGGHSSPKHPFNYNASDYRIRVDVGWSIRKDSNFKNLVKQRIKTKKVKIVGDDGKPKTKRISGHQQLTNALEKINKSYFLNRIEDNLDFKEDGSVEITIEYAGYIESEFRSNRLDALLTPELLKEKTVINEEYDKIITDGICKDNKERFEELVATYSAIEEDFIARSHRSIVNRLLGREKLHYCFIDDDDVSLFAKNGFFFGPPTLYLPKEIKVDGGEITTETIASDKDDPDAGEKEVFYDKTLKNFVDWDMGKAASLITFFYMGDLIDVCLDCMYKVDEPDKVMEDLKNVMFLLGSFDYYDINNNLKNINISQIPISTEYFFEWMNDKVIKNKRRTYPITLFIRDLCNKMISELMQEICVNVGKVEKSIRFNTLNLINAGDESVTSMPNMLDAGDVGEYALNVTDAYREGSLPFVSNIPTDKTIKDVENAFVVYAVVPTDGNNHNGRGKTQTDGETGIYHFQLGSDKGIMKRVKFNKTDIQYLREARFFSSGFNGLAQLGAVYSISVDMFGNSLFYPGMEIFIDPRNLGGSDFDPTTPASIANFLGIGGYHMITKVKQSLGPGKYNTTIEAIFTYSGDGNSRLIGQPIVEKETSLAKKADDFLNFDNATADACSSITYLRQIRLKDAEIKPSTPENLANYNAGNLERKVNEAGD